MPSFLSKVFGRKKDDKEPPRPHARASDGSLLEGKYEAVSPSATNFPDAVNGKSNGHGKEKERDSSFALFRAKSRPSSAEPAEKRVQVPHLSLLLPGPKEDPTARALGVVFEADPDAQILLPDSVIGQRRLTPLETLILVRACSQAITARGLETLGIMHPHWHSASADTQKKLISLFIHSLAPKSPITTFSPTPTSAVSAFESEISSTSSPHDVAAVLRWGLRHLQLENNIFGKEESWYKTYLGAERSSDYPPNAFSTALAPQLPAAHLELLVATLEIFSSLAARAEANGISGSKISKFFGLWLLTAQRTEASDDWSSFYARWERMGRMLEHLFLARIRDQALKSRMPTRLEELVKAYPYNKTAAADSDLLPRPRFSTRQYDALYVLLETELSEGNKKPAYHPLRLISQAFKAETAADNSSYLDLWNSIKKVGGDENNASSNDLPNLSRIFADETLTLLALLPVDGDKVSSPFQLISPLRPNGSVRDRSFSSADLDGLRTPDSNQASGSGHAKLTTELSKTTSLSSSSVSTDWAEFSTIGFGSESVSVSLSPTLDKDVEVTNPPSKPSKLPKRASLSPNNARKSGDVPRTTASIPEVPKPEPASLVSKSKLVSTTQLDEAFIDFWSDALLDPISSEWPAFILCKFKSDLDGLDIEGKRLQWLIIEQTFKTPAPPPGLADGQGTAESPKRGRAASPKPSFRSDTTFGATAKKRFSFFSTKGHLGEKATKGRKKATTQAPRVGEMGEILNEEEERPPVPKVPSSEEKKTAEEAAVNEKAEDRAASLPAVPAAAAAAAVAATSAAVDAVALAAAGKEAPGPSSQPAVESAVKAENGAGEVPKEAATSEDAPAVAVPTAIVPALAVIPTPDAEPAEQAKDVAPEPTLQAQQEPEHAIEEQHAPTPTPVKPADEPALVEENVEPSPEAPESLSTAPVVREEPSPEFKQEAEKVPIVVEEVEETSAVKVEDGEAHAEPKPESESAPTTAAAPEEPAEPSLAETTPAPKVAAEAVLVEPAPVEPELTPSNDATTSAAPIGGPAAVPEPIPEPATSASVQVEEPSSQEPENKVKEPSEEARNDASAASAAPEQDPSPAAEPETNPGANEPVPVAAADTDHQTPVVAEETETNPEQPVQDEAQGTSEPEDVRSAPVTSEPSAALTVEFTERDNADTNAAQSPTSVTMD